MKKIVLILFAGILFFCEHAVSQNFKEQYTKLNNADDTTGLYSLLKKWEAEKPDAPDMFIAFFNYYIDESRTEVLQIGDEPEGKEAFAIQDKDSSDKEPVSYIYGNDYYDPEICQKGLVYIDKAIQKYPNRLDMRFGKTYLFEQLGKYELLAAEVAKTVEYSSVINNKWLWTDNEAPDSPKEFMLSGIQDYFVHLFDKRNDSLYVFMQQIAESVLKYYPRSVENLSNLGVVYTMKDDFDKALEIFLKAEKLAPEDYIIHANIANVYKLKGDKANSIKYYELMLKYGDDAAKEFAKSKIEELKGK